MGQTLKQILNEFGLHLFLECMRIILNLINEHKQIALWKMLTKYERKAGISEITAYYESESTFTHSSK